MFNKKIIKYFLQAGAIAIVGAAIFWGVGYYRMRSSPEYKQLRELKEMKERYMAYTYGGDTPEETLQLFIDALKKGDIDLASKYFVLDKQEEWRGRMDQIRTKDKLSSMVNDLSRPASKYPLIKGDENSNTFIFEIRNDKNDLIAQMSVAKSPNNKWKRTDL